MALGQGRGLSSREELRVLSGVPALVPREGDDAPAAEVGCRGDGECWGESDHADSEWSDNWSCPMAVQRCLR